MGTLITLLTDFGTQDSYVAEVKAVLLKGIPKATLVDITHEIPPYQIEPGAFQLLRAHSHFPKGTWHLAVVDPGVGTARRAIYARTQNHHFVGPDNGLLLWAVRACETREGRAARIFEIPRSKVLFPTFHGRDVFAPFVVEQLRRPARKLISLVKLAGREFPMGHPHGVGVRGEILIADHFGNLVTSVPVSEELEVEAAIEGIKERLTSVPNYSAIPQGKAALLPGSHGFWEIACCAASASSKLKLKPGTHVTFFPARVEGTV